MEDLVRLKGLKTDGLIENQIDFLQDWRTQLGQVMSPVSEELLQWMEEQPLQRQVEVAAALEPLTDPDHDGIESGDISQIDEIRLLNQFLTRFGLSLTDKSIYELLQKDSFFEIYSNRGIQLYRSWNFFKFCRYTITDLHTYNWEELYVRPDFVEKKLYSLIPKIFGPEKKVVPYNIPEYIIEEKRLSPAVRHKIEMTYACPIESVDSGEVVAFLSVATAKQLDH